MIEVVINPRAGGKVQKARDAVIACCEKSGVPYHIYTATSKEDTISHCRELSRKGTERIVVLGGDGTIRDAAEGIAGSKTVMGIVPCGTGNDFVRAAGIPQNIQEAAEAAVCAKGQWVDLILHDGHIAANYVGAGIDSTAGYNAKQQKVLKGMAAYLWGLLKALIHLKHVRYRCVLDDGAVIREGVGTILDVANGRYFGGGIQAFPVSEISDGYLDVMLTIPLNRRQIIGVLPVLIKGKHAHHRYVEFLRCKKAVFEFSEPTPIGADGEVEYHSGFTAEILPRAILIATRAQLPRAEEIISA